MLCWSARALPNLSARVSRGKERVKKGGTEGVDSVIEGESLLLSELRHRRGNEAIERSNALRTHETCWGAS